MRQFLIRPHLYILVSLIGICLKFYHLDYKLLWIDEIYTIQHTSGIPDREYPALIPTNEIKSVSFYLDLYHLKKQNYGMDSQLKGLLASPQLNPLHYPLLMIWYRIVGDDPVQFRLFSVVAFLMTLPFLFLLSKKLFDSNLAGWISVSLYALSPYFHLFAQEARYYILWAFILVVLHYVFLQAVDRNQARWWLACAVAASLSFYASPVSIIIVFGYLVFVGITRRDLLQRFAICMSGALLIYLPWALSLFSKLDAITSGLSWQSGSRFNVTFWLPLLGQCLYVLSIFSFKVDYLTAFEKPSFDFTSEGLTVVLFNTAVLALLIGSLVFLFTRTDKNIKYFLVLIIIPGCLFFFLYDLMRHAMTSWWWRYLIFIGPGMILVMTSLLYKKIEEGRLMYVACYVGLAFVGASSIISIAGARHWHIGKRMDSYIEEARVMLKAGKPLVITDFVANSKMVDFMVVMQECKSHDIDILRASPAIDDVENRIRHEEPREYSDIYVLYASDELTANLRSQFDGRMEKLGVEGTSPVWKITIDERKSGVMHPG
jgi:uncharacterized membrane protein